MRDRTQLIALCGLLAATALNPAQLEAAPAPSFVNVDGNGVDLTTGLVWMRMEEGGIGSGDGAVRMQRIWAQDARWTDNWSGSLYEVTVGSTTTAIVEVNGISDRFTKSGSTYTSQKADGSTLAPFGVGRMLYTQSDGTTVEFSTTTQNSTCPNTGIGVYCRVPLVITRPNGLKFTLVWDAVTLNGSWVWRRFKSVTSSAGYSATVNFVTDNAGTGVVPPDDWFRRSTVTFGNSVNPPSPVPTISYSYPNASVIEVTDPAGRAWQFTMNASKKLIGVRRPGSAADNLSYVYGNPDGTISSATKDGVTTTYSRNADTATSTIYMFVTDALSQQSRVDSDMAVGRPTRVEDALHRITQYRYDANGRVDRVFRPEGNGAQYSYDARGNVTQVRQFAKSGSGLADIISSASYPASCANPKTCNKPTSTTDARGNAMAYTYDGTHGGVLTVTPPLVATGVQPQTRYTYAAVTSASGVAVTMLTNVKACPTGTTSCTTLNEVKTTIGYNSNLLPTTITRGNTSGSLAATSAMSYDPRGNLSTVDGPLSGTSDTIKYRYDAADQTIGVTSPDPDGAGVLKMRAVRLTYRPDGQVSKQEFGTVNSQSDPDWANFASLETVDITYDANSRVKTSKLSAGGTDYALSQMSYDGLGRPDCLATRMNPAIYGSLPASACTLGTQGSFGPDRISQTVYDAASQPTQLKVAVGTSDAATERTLTYTSNGKVQTLKDAENNLTTYEYDGHDRLSKTRMPLPTKGANASSTTDYEQLSYDANGNVINRRLRDAQNIVLTYDKLNRVTLKDLPGSEPDVTYGYDNLGRLTSASQTGNSLTYSYDALSRNLTQVGPQGTVASQWDLAGRRTRLTYPGSGLFVDYDYLVTGETTKIRENGATSGIGVLATFGYDDLGRRTSLTFGNGASQAYGYDPVSRLTSLTNNLTGTAGDLSLAMTYNPASQIGTSVRTGDAYAWTAHYNENRNYTANGLNQFTASGAITPTYDSRGNLTSAGTTTYAYSSENMLRSATGGTSVTLSYDPGLRLYEVAGSSATRFTYDGLDLIAEYDGANALLRRHVHGPGIDQPIVWYEGSGTTDRRFLGSDERGSIVSVTDGSGSLLAIDSYDEYGMPGTANVGRFQYTGQVWLPDLGIYHYKARAYSPTLGRFLQTDPIGYGEGLNIYAYVGNDPVNFIDPSGMCTGSLISNDNGTCYGGGGFIAGSNAGSWGDGYTIHNSGDRNLRTVTAASSSFASPDSPASGFDPLTAEIIVSATLYSGGGFNSANELNGAFPGLSLGVRVEGGVIVVPAGFRGRGGSGGGGGAGGSWLLPFANLRDHWARHGEALGTETPDRYHQFAQTNTEVGSRFRFRHNGEQRLAHITRTGSLFVFTSTNLSITRIYTHMLVDQQYLANQGITLPRGF
jgi:RHS repeat-associated protein